jgi:uncharacterized membrane protein (UPF0127 family)
MKWWVILLLALLTVPVAAQADTDTPLYYSRSTLTIHTKSEPPKSALPWENNASGIGFNVEVRDAMAMYNQKGWFNLSSQSDKNGVMMVFSAEGLAPVIRMTQYAPFDILLIDHEGNIKQIIPNIKLSDLSDDITPASPVLAFLFLKGGTCQKLGIAPGDIVDYRIFKRPPVVLSAPGATPAPQQAAPVQYNTNPPGLTELMSQPTQFNKMAPAR